MGNTAWITGRATTMRALTALAQFSLLAFSCQALKITDNCSSGAQCGQELNGVSAESVQNCRGASCYINFGKQRSRKTQRNRQRNRQNTYRAQPQYTQATSYTDYSDYTDYDNYQDYQANTYGQTQYGNDGWDTLDCFGGSCTHYSAQGARTQLGYRPRRQQSRTRTRYRNRFF